MSEVGRVHVLQLFAELEHQRERELRTANYWAERWQLMGNPHYAAESREEAKKLFLELELLRAAINRFKTYETTDLN